MTGNEIRSTFLKFFEERGHRVVRSSSLVPANDPTLLFTNAGMNQFKDVFLGLDQRDYTRAATCQKCVRAGGKHNDLENVGFTNRHHTFFEMLGNFSFGDYFKQDAIAFAWELITSPKWLGIPIEKLFFTVFGGAEIGHGQALKSDQEAHALWTKIGAPKERVIEVPGLKENFWAMGDTGPCGPCSEIHYDMGPAASDQDHADCQFPCDCGRYVEIWNLVFMQFNRDSSGKLNPLPKPSVDTGMGLERLAAVLQGKISNFDTDLFQPLITQARGMIGQFEDTPDNRASLRIIADHVRATTFLISDGVIPANEGRGYVLRKIMRRALRHARLLGGNLYLLSNLSQNVADQMQNAYPELRENIQRVRRVIDSEAERFSHTIEIGMSKLNAEIEPLIRERQRQKKGMERVEAALIQEAAPTGRAPGEPSITQLVNQFSVPYEWFERAARTHGLASTYNPERFEVAPIKPYSGEEAFKLWDTYGLPRDFIEDVTRDAGIQVDWAGFDRAMEEQRTRARASWKGVHKEVANPIYAKLADTFETEPDFYFGTSTSDCRIEAIVTKHGEVNEIRKGAEAEVILDRTSFYSESGGQVGDVGSFYDNSSSLDLAEVRGTYYPVSRLIAHRILAKEDLRVGDRVTTVADAQRRARNMRNHTATHLMHAALRNILGAHVKQAGSLVAPDHLRFDFSHFAAVDSSEISDIEQQVNEEIWKDLELQTDITNIDDALASGALAFFGDKYPEQNVRVVTIPDASEPRGFFSKELCGGTHVARIGEIGVFKILSEQSTAAGVRRIEAISGDRALAEYQRFLSELRAAAGLLNVSEDEVYGAIQRQIDQIKDLERQLKALVRRNSVSQAEGLLEGVREVKGVRVLAAKVDGFDREALRQMTDALRQKLGSGVVVLASAEDGKVSLIAAVTKDLTGKLHAGKIIQELAKLVGGSGGGRPDLAEAGGKDTSGVENAIRNVYPLLDRLL